MAKRALIVSSPSDVLKLFPALVVNQALEQFFVFAFYDEESELDVDGLKGLLDLAPVLGFNVVSFAVSKNAAGRMEPDDLAAEITSALTHYEVDEAYTHSPQGDKGLRGRADVAYAVSKAAYDRPVFYRGKHISSSDAAFGISLTEAQNLDSLYHRLFEPSAEEADRSACVTEHYALLTREEVRLAYLELSHGFAGVRRLVAEGDTNPWGYETSAYARERMQAVCEIVLKIKPRNSGLRIIEVGAAAGSMTSHLLNAHKIAWIRALEPCREFERLLKARFLTDRRIRVEPTTLERNVDWDSDLVLLSDCLYYVDNDLQLSKLSSILREAPAVLLAGDRRWAEGLARKAQERVMVNLSAVVHVPGRLEPLRPGLRVHSPRPSWAAVLLNR